MKNKSHMKFLFWYEINNFIYKINNFMYEINNFMYEINNFMYEINNFMYEISIYEKQIGVLKEHSFSLHHFVYHTFVQPKVCNLTHPFQ